MFQQPLFAPEHTSDALGEAFCKAMLPERRRSQGITLTPSWLVDCMVDRVAALPTVDTIVDAGAGSGRFCIAVARRLPQARIIAVERNAQMLTVLRRNVYLHGFQHRVQVVEGDFRDVHLMLQGRAVFVGNPPYVRHHDIEPQWKAWYAQGMAALGIAASQLAGLHAHFLLRMAQLMRPGDHLCLVAAAEWLDNGYGGALRALLTASPMLVRGLWVAPPNEPVFADALVSAAVLMAERSVAPAPVELGLLTSCALSTRRTQSIDELRVAGRWTELCQPDAPAAATGIELGALFKIVRGQVTGLNDAWILPPHGDALPAGLSLPCITRGREIIDGTVESADALAQLRRVAHLPHDLGSVSPQDQQRVALFLENARARGAARGYVATQRRHWHALDLRAPPLAFVTYMGRRPPVFRTNPHAVSFLNIAHGLYPREPVTAPLLTRILAHLNLNTRLYSGRVYGGGLAKFEPSDIARLRIPAHVMTGDA